MNLQFFILFEGDTEYTEITNLIKDESITIEKALFNDDFESVQDSLSATIIYNEEINAKFNSATTWMKAYVTSDLANESNLGYAGGIYGTSVDEYGFLESGRIFTGAVYPNTEESYTGEPDSTLSFEIVDNSYLLEKDNVEVMYPPIDIVYPYYVFNTGDKTHSIIHQLLYLSGITDVSISDAVSFGETIDNIYIEEGKSTYQELIQDILYEFHYVYYFDGDGIFHIYNFKYDVINTTATIKNEDILSDGINRERNILDIDGYTVKYDTYFSKTNALVYRFDTGEGKIILPSYTIPTKALTTTVYQEFSTKWLGDNTTLISSGNHVLEATYDTGIVVTTENYEVLQAQIIFTNVGGTGVYLKQFDIRADVIYSMSDNEITIPVVNTKTDEITTKYLHTVEQATDLGQTLYNNSIIYGKYLYSFLSLNKYTLGQQVNISTIYNVDAIIHSFSYNPDTKKYTYNLMGLGAHQVQDTTGHETDSSNTNEILTGIKLTASSSVMNFSQRSGSDIGSNPVAFVSLTNITDYTITWTCNELSLLAIVGANDLTRECDKSTLSGDNATITVTVVSNGVTYTDSITLSKVFTDTEQPEYLGMYDAFPTKTSDNRNLLVGDWILWTNYEGTVIDGLETITDLQGDTDGFDFGKVYEHTSVGWIETNDSAKMSAIIPDALLLAKNTGKTVYASQIYTNNLVSQDITITGTLKSSNYTETDNIPTAGFELDGPSNIIKSFGGSFKDCDVYGSFTSDEFATQKEQPGQTFLAQAPVNTLWNEADFYNNFPVNERDLTGVDGEWNGTTLVKATKMSSSNYVRFYNKPDHPTVTISGSPFERTVTSSADLYYGVLFSFTIPGTYGSVVRLKAHATLPGNMNWMELQTNYGAANNNWVDVARQGNSDMYINRFVNVGEQYRFIGNTNAWWGSQTMTLQYFEYDSINPYVGTVGADVDYNLIQMTTVSPTAYHEYNYSIGTYNGLFNTNNFLTKKSGSTIVDAIANVPSYISARGNITVEGYSDLIDAVKKNGTVVTFRSANIETQVSKFVEGTSVGVYSVLSTGNITAISQIGAIRTTGVVPKDDDMYDLGQLGDSITVPSWSTLLVNASVGDRVRGSTGDIYVCISSVGSIGLNSEPIKGTDWATYWELDTDTSGTKIRYRNGYFSGTVNADNLFGQGQTWQSVSRTSGTTYYNTTSRPIMISVYAGLYGSPQGIVLKIDGITVGDQGAGTDTLFDASISSIVPVNSSYVVFRYSTGGNFEVLELR